MMFAGGPGSRAVLGANLGVTALQKGTFRSIPQPRLASKKWTRTRGTKHWHVASKTRPPGKVPGRSMSGGHWRERWR